MQFSSLRQTLLCRVEKILTGLRHFFSPILILLITAGACFLPGYAPILYFDDWYTFGQLYIFGGLRLIDWTDRRPLLNAAAKILLDLFGLNLRALYLADIFVIFLGAAAFFFLARRLFPRHQYLALPAALLFLVFPVDLTHVWLSQNYRWIDILATLIVFYLLLDFAEKGGFWKLAVSLPLIVLPLGGYEGQLGVVVAWSVLLAVFTRRVSYQRRLLLLYPLAIGGLFMIWRFIFQPVVLNVRDPYMGFQSNAGIIKLLADRFAAIFPVFVNCWILPFSSLLGISPRKMLLIICGAVFCSGLLALWVSKEPASSSQKNSASVDRSDSSVSGDPGYRVASPTGPLTWMDKKQESRDLVAIFGAGVVMLLAGYFPGLLIVKPTLDWFGSRVNMFAIYGAALAFTAAIALIGLWVASNRQQMRFIVVAAMLPFILMGATEQIWNQNEARLAWAVQKDFWQALFKAVPNLKDGSTLVIAMPHGIPDRPFWRLPFTAQWEVAAGLKVLYNNPSLRAVPYTPNHVEGDGYAALTPEGVKNNNYGLIPYDKVVFVYYEMGTHAVKVVEPENAEALLRFPVKGYAPEKYILPDPPQSTPYRGLVSP